MRLKGQGDMALKTTELSRRDFLKGTTVAGSLAVWNPWETLTEAADWLWDRTKEGADWVWEGTKTGADWVWDGSKWVANGLASATAQVWDRVDPQEKIVYVHEDLYPFVVGGTGSAAVTGWMLNTFRAGLPWEELPGDLQQKYRLAGGEWKNVPQARQLYQRVPYAVRLGGPSAIWQFHKLQDWSHIVPKSMGGNVTEGIWWDRSKNRALGAQPMSQAQIMDAHRLIFHDNVIASMRHTLNASVKGGLTGVALSVILSSLTHGLAYAQGDITLKELYTLVGTQALLTGGVAFALSGAVTFPALLFPALIPIMAPLTGILFLVGLGTLGFEMHGLAQDWWQFLTTEAGVGPKPSSP